jgi:tetratricopeptide (TPR) repeat protein
MIEAGETEIAVDELRWLLNGCGDFVEAHRLLGELALLEGDIRLARGHFGYAYQIAVTAIDRAPRGALFPYARKANQAFLESAKGLAHCLKELGRTELAREVLERMLKLDPSDPLGAKVMLAALRT